MKKIIVFGAGRSASSLIKYFLDNSITYDWSVTVADVSKESAEQSINKHSHGRALAMDIHNEDQRAKEIRESDIVISLLPAVLHTLVAGECLKQKKNLVTASYVSPEMRAMSKEVEEAGILFMNEIGLDPGIDHMSAMELIDKLREEKCVLSAFRSYCGGLIAPKYNDNPWGYKFTWNPRNVVLAGQGTAKFIKESKYKYIPYSRLFSSIEQIHVDGLGDFEAYANRDSLSYRHYYHLEHIPTMLRGTLRMPGYCQAWDTFVQLGITDDSFVVEHSDELTYAEFIKAFLPIATSDNLKKQLADFLNLSVDSEIIKKIEWLGILENEKINLPNATPAQILQQILEQKWKLAPGDKDMIVMQHQFEYTRNGKKEKLTSSMGAYGDDSVHTAMANTVGLPVAIVTKLILNGEIKLKGVQIPVMKEVYKPVLEELKQFGVAFVEKTEVL